MNLPFQDKCDREIIGSDEEVALASDEPSLLVNSCCGSRPDELRNSARNEVESWAARYLCFERVVLPAVCLAGAYLPHGGLDGPLGLHDGPRSAAASLVMSGFCRMKSLSDAVKIRCLLSDSLRASKSASTKRFTAVAKC